MPNIHPVFTDIETVEATLDTDEHGVATIKVSYYAFDDEACYRLLRRGKTCPLVAAGMVRSARFMHGDANLSGESPVWKVNLVWKGISVHARLDEAAVPTLTPTALTAPIETHPNFEKFAGTPIKPLNGAKFDGQDNFVQFNPQLPNKLPNPKAGVKNYYQAILKVGEKRVIKQSAITSQSDWRAVGKISIPDVRGLVSIKLKTPGLDGAKRDYLLTSVVLEDLGNGFASLEREWDCSGPFGWDKDIYAYEDTGDASKKTY